MYRNEATNNSGKKSSQNSANDKKKKCSESEIITDPLGSWTGVPVYDPKDRPIQDADDL